MSPREDEDASFEAHRSWTSWLDLVQKFKSHAARWRGIVRALPRLLDDQLTESARRSQLFYDLT